MFKTVEVGLLNNNVSIMIFLIYVSQHLHYLHTFPKTVIHIIMNAQEGCGLNR